MVEDFETAPLEEREKGLLRYCVKLTREPAACCERDVQELRELGWSDEAIHDGVQVAAYFNYINRVADALGVDLEDFMES